MTLGIFDSLQLPILGIILPKMGSSRKTSEGLGIALFPRVRLRVLGVLFGQPDRRFLVSEVIKLAQSGNGAVVRELDRLRGAGLIWVDGKTYQANRASPIFEELRGIVVKTVGLIEPIRSALRPFEPRIDLSFVYGSVAKGQDTASSDIDLMIVSDKLSYGDLFKALQKAEKSLHRSVNPTLLTTKEWSRKKAEKGSFVNKVVQQPRLDVFGAGYGAE
ncbi:MAG TPA: nucleotidyltransferase domain-containing protein [Xanthobacteraceae bacterium]|nr:nucleotidyltransferase domain-containing protein [Xanthobacteraceae bacterium]